MRLSKTHPLSSSWGSGHRPLYFRHPIAERSGMPIWLLLDPVSTFSGSVLYSSWGRLGPLHKVSKTRVRPKTSLRAHRTMGALRASAPDKQFPTVVTHKSTTALALM